jgi:hypothetical protein
MISPEKEVEPNNIIITKESSPEQEVNTQTTTQINEGPTVVKVSKIITTSEPVTETHVTNTKITTITRGGEPISTSKTTRYNNTGSTYIPKVTQTKTTTSSTNSYVRPNIIQSGTYNRGGKINVTTSNINNKNTTTNNNKNYRNINQPSRVQNSQSYSGNRNQPQRPQVSSSNYKPKAVSPGPGTIKRKTINRGKPVENIQITHIIYSPRPLEFHITEDLNLDNLNKPPIQISEKERNDLQKSGKVEVYCSCDSDKIKPPEPVNLDGKLTHYQHAQGIGMTDDKNPNINPKFYFSEIKTLEPILLNKGEPNTEIMPMRSDGKSYTTTKTVTKTVTKAPAKPVTNYSNTRGTNNYTQNRSYNNAYQPKTNIGVSNRGNVSTAKTTTSTTKTNTYRGASGTGDSGKIVKETTTKVQMGSRSQFQNQSKPITTTSTERKVYDKNNFFKK